MKRKLTYFTALIFVCAFAAQVLADTPDENDYRVVTGMNLIVAYSHSLVAPHDRNQEGDITEVTIAPFSPECDLLFVRIYAVVRDQFGYEIWEEDIILYISCSLGNEVTYDVFDYEIMIETDVIDRVITVTATSYSDPNVYATVVITVDPNHANIRNLRREHEGRLLGGEYSRLTVPINFITVPDGTYAAFLSTSPREDFFGSPMSHDFSGMRIAGWRTADLEATGRIRVVDGIGHIVFISYDTPASFNRYWTWMTLKVDMGEFGVVSTRIQIEFGPSLDPPPPPALAEIRIYQSDVTRLPDSGRLITSFRAYNEFGGETWFREGEGIVWSADGLDEGDYLRWDDSGLNHFIYVGPSQRERVITLTASYINNPAIYDSFKVTVSPYFVQEVNEILISDPLGLYIEAVRYILPANSSEIVPMFALDQYGLEMPHDSLIWTVNSVVEDDRIEMVSWGFVVFSGVEDLARDITVIAASPTNPEIYATAVISVFPSLPTLGLLEVVNIEGTLTSGTFESAVITLSMPYLPDGTYRGMLSIGNSGLRWDAPNPSFQNGWASPWGDITFTDGVAAITLSSNRNTNAGELELRLSIRLPDELSETYFFSPFVFFTVTVE